MAVSDMLDFIAKNYVLILHLVLTVANCEIPEYIDVCRHDHKNLSGCIINSMYKLRPRLREGIPELNVPPMEPLQIDSLTTNLLGETPTNMTNLLLTGASDFEILKLTPKLKKNGYNIHYVVNTPLLRLKGDYEIASKILFLNVEGTGSFTMTATNFRLECFMKGHKVNKDGANHLIFEKLKCNTEREKSEIQLDNLFNGNPALGKATNDAINDNSDVFFETLKPTLNNQLEDFLTVIANKITNAFKYEELFP